MIARPIPFSAPMVRACLEGREGQTRRVVDPQPQSRKFPGQGGYEWSSGRKLLLATSDVFATLLSNHCHYGGPGDLLWVREAWRVSKTQDHKRPSEILPSLIERGQGITVLYEAGGWRSVGPAGREEPTYSDNEPMPEWAGKYRHSRFMPRSMSRCTLRITDIRVERLQEISEDDAKAEGLLEWSDPPRVTTKHYGIGIADVWETDPRKAYARLWKSINGPDSWDANPFVWVIAFDVIKANVDEVMKREAA